MPELDIPTALRLQREAEAVKAELARLDLVQQQLNDETIAEVIAAESARLHPLVFPDAPAFEVPDLAQFIDGELCLGLARIERP